MKPAKLQQYVTTTVRMKDTSDRKTSQELVQRMLSASFGCITYLRGIFPDEIFLEERLATTVQTSKQPGSVQGQKIMRIKRDAMPQATQLLDYIV